MSKLVGLSLSDPRHYHFHWHQCSPLTRRLSSQPSRSFIASSLSFSSTSVFTTDPETELTAWFEFQSFVTIIFIDISFTTVTETELTA